MHMPEKYCGVLYFARGAAAPCYVHNIVPQNQNLIFSQTYSTSQANLKEPFGHNISS
jgi:hypothetical protein